VARPESSKGVEALQVFHALPFVQGVPPFLRFRDNFEAPTLDLARKSSAGRIWSFRRKNP
jgi:hypothetical protein